MEQQKLLNLNNRKEIDLKKKEKIGLQGPVINIKDLISISLDS